MIFYTFYYSGFGVAVVIKYLLGILMSLMRGPVVEEPIVEIKEEEKVSHLRLLPPLPPAEDPNTQLQPFGTEVSKEDAGQ